MLRAPVCQAIFLAIGGLCIPPTAQTTATNDIETTSTTPIYSNFSGINDDVAFAAEFWDYCLNTLARTIRYGWARGRP
jgi:hypothetical protein